MSQRLVDRIRGVVANQPEPVTAPQQQQQATSQTSPEYERIKRLLHKELIETIDLSRLKNKSRKELDPQLRATLATMVGARRLPLSRDEERHIVEDVINEVLGLGPLEKLLGDQTISDILINGADTVFIEKGGKLIKTDVRFNDDQHLMHIIDRIVSGVGRRIDESNPMVDARLPDGSRVNAIIPPLALDGPSVSIRRFGTKAISALDLVRFGAMPAPMMEFVQGCVRSKLNILISGGTGTGKTTLLNVLSSFIPQDERIITIEDAAELRLQQPHVVRLETRPPNLEGEGEVTARDLVRNALRMRPDRIVVGEIRGSEAIDMLQAMNTGHEGSLGTIHANSPRHAFRRLETMVGLGLGNISGTAIREMIADALHLLVQVKRLQDGTRRIVSITEVTGIHDGEITTQEVFRFVQRTVEPSGRVRGSFRATGLRPVYAEKLESYGIAVPPNLLTLDVEV